MIDLSPVQIGGNGTSVWWIHASLLMNLHWFNREGINLVCAFKERVYMYIPDHRLVL